MNKNGTASIGCGGILLLIIVISQMPKDGWVIILVLAALGLGFYFWKEHQKQSAEQHKTELLNNIEKEWRYDILEKFNKRYPTPEEKTEHIVDLKNLIFHQKHIAVSIEDIQYMLEKNSMESNIDIIKNKMAGLTNKSPSHVAKMLLSIARPTFLDNNGKVISTTNAELEYKEQHIEGILDIFEKYLERNSLKYNIDELGKYLNSELVALEAIKFQRKLSRDTDNKITVKLIEGMDGFEFEKLLGRVYRQAGYKVRVTKKSGDQGADLIIEKDGISTAIQAKRYSGNVGNGAIQEIVAAKKFYDCDNAMVITTANFTKSAIELANRNGVELVDKKGLDKLFDSIL